MHTQSYNGKRGKNSTSRKTTWESEQCVTFWALIAGRMRHERRPPVDVTIYMRRAGGRPRVWLAGWHTDSERERQVASGERRRSAGKGTQPACMHSLGVNAQLACSLQPLRSRRSRSPPQVIATFPTLFSRPRVTCRRRRTRRRPADILDASERPASRPAAADAPFPRGRALFPAQPNVLDFLNRFSFNIGTFQLTVQKIGNRGSLVLRFHALLL